MRKDGVNYRAKIRMTLSGIDELSVGVSITTPPVV